MARPPRSATYTPDYQALINQDPAFAALQQQLSAQDTQDAAQRQAATEQALIHFGMVPDFGQAASQLGLSPEALAMLQHDIDPHAAQLARANTAAGLSTEAGLQQGQEQAIRSLRNALAAHGALSSGDDAYRTNLQDQSYARAQSDALQQLLASIGGYQQQYLSGRQAADQQRQQGLQSAMQFESGLAQNQGFHLHYDVKHGVYRDASGTAYKPHRNHDGSWTLTNSATGAHYTLGSDGQLHSGSGAPPSPGSPPPQTAGQPNVPPLPGNVPGPTGGGTTPGLPPDGGTSSAGGYGAMHGQPGHAARIAIDALHSTGHDAQAAKIWLDRHQGAIASGHTAYAPAWVRSWLPGHAGQPPPNHPGVPTPGLLPPVSLPDWLRNHSGGGTIPPWGPPGHIPPGFHPGQLPIGSIPPHTGFGPPTIPIPLPPPAL